MPSFTCRNCGTEFLVAAEVLAKYPGWTPRTCFRCKKKLGTEAESSRGGGTSVSAAERSQPRRRSTAAAFGSSREENLTTAEVLARYTAGPQDGVFTDGAAHPNPGPGGWGAVYVIGGEIQTERFGQEPDTTNNRMELTALIVGTQIVPEGMATTLWTDSQLCVKTMNEWAHAWKARGWKKKDGEIKNLALVQELYGILQQRTELKVEWIKAHAGNRWNEYADSLASAYRRSVK
jgi:ribonuclease HI